MEVAKRKAMSSSAKKKRESSLDQSTRSSRSSETVILKCQLDKPARRVSGGRMGLKFLATDEQGHYENRRENRDLEIRNFDAHDVGQYTATVSASEESTAAKLSLQVGPSIHVPQFIEQPVIVHAREELDFVVEFTGHPMPNVKVYLNSVSIKDWIPISSLTMTCYRFEFAI